jgi:hypothetical protein
MLSENKQTNTLTSSSFSFVDSVDELELVAFDHNSNSELVGNFGRRKSICVTRFFVSPTTTTTYSDLFSSETSASCEQVVGNNDCNNNNSN